MKLRYTIIGEPEHRFTVVAVQKSFLKDRVKAEQAVQWLQTRYFHMPTALMSYDDYGTPTAYYGRRDLALLLAQVSPTAMSWRELAISGP